MSANIKTDEQLIVEKHTQHLHAGYHTWSHDMLDVTRAMGDFRWTNDLILSTYYQAEHCEPPQNNLEYKTGQSAGGFDVLDFNWLAEDQWTPGNIKIDLSIPLNRKGEGSEITIPIPI
ncbi:MAG: hypothetical protein P8Y72_06740 [Anaerolineales bacterium]